MDSRQRLRLIISIIALGTLAFAWQAAKLGVKFANNIRSSQQAQVAAVKVANRAPLKKGRVFTNTEIYAFLAAAKQAELIKDPLQRCLTYPDPPGSHWTAVAVQAYCRYRVQPLMPFAEMQKLIQSGQAAELDQRLAATLVAQQTQPGARGLLDRTFELAFDGSFDQRSTLDAWKRDSPKSAFAYAASGLSYERMAHVARGSALIANTPAANQESMSRLLQQADADLQQAVVFDPKMMPAYAAMILVGGHGRGDDYTDLAIKRALAADSANFSIYDAMLWKAQPKWGGSMQAMARVAADAQKAAGANPLLTVLLEKVPAYDRLDDCECHTEADLSTYTTLFDEVATAQQLLSAASAAESDQHLELAVVYFSEALRFAPEQTNERLHRIYALNNFDESRWAVDEATALMRASPKDADPVKARAYSYTMLNDPAHAEEDKLAVLALDPGDKATLSDLQRQYIHAAQWDKAWMINERLVKFYPDAPFGWRMRAKIQMQQPRAGLQQTIDYFAVHFDTTTLDHRQLLEMRASLALQPKARH